MHVAVLKSILALAVSSVLFAGSAIFYQRRRTLGSALQLLGTASFVVVALAHVCEALAILPVLGWGQPHSTGHYIDLGAAVLGVTSASAGLLFQYAHRGQHVNTLE